MSQAANQHRLEVRELTCSRGDRQLFHDITFNLNAGQLLYLQGHNGSGKTTLLRSLAGLLIPERGEILWNGSNTRRERQAFQQDLLFLGHLNGLKGDLSAVENLRYHSALRGAAIAEADAWQTLSDIGLRGFEDLPVKYLSQGQKRRVALARLWLDRSALWVLDEPFSALDTAAVASLQEVIRKHLHRGGMAILTTHQEVPLIDTQVQRLELGKRLRNADA